MTGREQTWLCVRCGYAMDAFDCLQHPDAMPKDGDLSLCMNCGFEYVRHADRWQPMTAAERAALEPEDRRTLEEMQFVRSRVITEDLSKRDGRA